MKTSVFLLAALSSASAFTTPNTANPRPTTSLSMSNSDNNGKTFAASALAAAYLLTGVVSADAAFAMDAMNGPVDHSLYGSSSTVLAARSGGRTGGRAPARVAPAASSTTKVYNTKTTIVQPAPVVVGSPYGYGGGYGGYYDPTPGIALNLGLSAVSAVGNGMREYRQTEQIAQSRAELSAAKEREADMAERIRQLERMQMQQGGAPNGQAPVYYYAPPPGQPAGQPVQVMAPPQQ